MNQTSRYTQQITVIELLNEVIREHIDKAADLIQGTENTLYAKDRVDLKQYLKQR